MNIYEPFLIALRKPSDLPASIQFLNLRFGTVIEGAIFIATCTALLSSSLDILVFRSDENKAELFSNNSLTFLFNPFAMFVFELIFIFVLLMSITLFGRFSNKNVSFEELGKNILFICLVALIFKVFQTMLILFSYELYIVLRTIEMIWFIWAISSVVSTLYFYRSVLLTAVVGIITVSFIMGFAFVVIVSMIQLLFYGESLNV